jgi:hypothetical protein
MSAIHNAEAQLFRRAGYAISTNSRLKFRSWKTEADGVETQISQWAFPVYIHYPVTRQLTFRINDSISFSSLDDKASLNGLSDLKVKASYRMMADSVLLAAGLGLPIGKNSLDIEQAEVASELYTDVFDFAVTRLGEGLILNLAAATAREVGAFVVGAGAGYLHKGPYETTADVDTKYNPGNEMNLTGGVNWKREQLRFRIDLIYTLYTVDKVGDEEVFQQGNQLTTEMSLTYRPQPFFMSISVRETMLGKNDYPNPRGKLETAEKNIHGNRLNLNFILGYEINEPITIYGTLGINQIAKNDYGRNGASIFTFGVGMRYALRSLILNTGLNLATGSRNDNDISGFGLDLGVNYRF